MTLVGPDGIGYRCPECKTAMEFSHTHPGNELTYWNCLTIDCIIVLVATLFEPEE